MKKKEVVSIVKKLTASVLAVGMIVTGIVVYPTQADAAVVADEVIYIQSDDEQTYEIKDYWNADEEKRTAPVKEGYVFGGWFETADESRPLTEEALKVEVPDSAYAKFVPAQVLSVKAQNEDGVTEQTIAAMREKNNKNEAIPDEDKFYVRVMSSLDSENYTKVGFDIYLNNTKKLENTETEKIYTGVMVKGKPQYAQDIYGGASRYLMTWRLTEIDWADNVKLIIYVRPYWVTTDGTTVKGLGKYVHIEDEYLEYINVPVNLLGGEQVAAGAIDVTYDAPEQLQLVAFEKGRMFEKMNYIHTGNTVKMVGNTNKQMGTYDDKGETIYANLRFEKPASNTVFSILNEANKFCDWDENFVDVKKVWDTKYVQTTTN